MGYFLLMGVILGSCAVFLKFRNDWVYKVRVAMIHSDFERFGKLKSYHKMVYTFWIWDIEKFYLDEQL